MRPAIISSFVRHPVAPNLAMAVMILAVLAVAGILMANGTIHNYLAANTADNLFHVVSGLVAVGAAVLASERPDGEQG